MKKLLSPPKSLFLYFLIFTFIPLLPLDSHGQMFSVGDRERERGIPTNSLSLSLIAADFSFKGDPSAINAGIFEFSGVVPRIRYEAPGLELFLSRGGSFTGLDDIDYFDMGFKIQRLIPLTGSEKVRLALPLLLKTSFTTVSTDQPLGAVQFEQATIDAGTGLRLAVTFSEQFRFRSEATPFFGITFDTRRTSGTGSIFEFESQNRFYFDGLFGSLGLSVGYDLEFRSYNVEEERFDYNLLGHNFLLGITF